MNKEWFNEWFDSPYYHILYKNHDDDDARRVVDALLETLHLPPHARIMDLACGKGRHARYLAEKGFEVTGLDISPASILFARQFEQDGLTFFQHDMRLPFRINYYDAVMNMFTSFGYFEHDSDHLKTLKNIAKGLKMNGLFLLDYFNSIWVKAHMEEASVKTVEGIEFHMSRRIENGHVYKTVAFEAEGKSYKFQERVRLFELEDFRLLLDKVGMTITQTFGDYGLTPFDASGSKRLILVAQKTRIA